MDQRTKQTIIAGLTGLLGIILILGVIWVVSKRYRFNDYHDKTRGFAIKYPAAWSLEKDQGGASVIFFTPMENELDYFRESVNVVVQDLSNASMTLKAYTDLAIKQMNLVFKENFIIVESSPTVVAGQVAHKLIFIGKGPDVELKYMSVWLIKGATAYQITYTAFASQYERYIGKMKKMVSSFRVD